MPRTPRGRRASRPFNGSAADSGKPGHARVVSAIVSYCRVTPLANPMHATRIPSRGALPGWLERVGRLVGQLELLGAAACRRLHANLDRPPFLRRVGVGGVVANQVVVAG